MKRVAATLLPLALAASLLGAFSPAHADEVAELISYGKALFESGNYEESIEYLEKARSSRPADTSITNYLVRVCKLVGVQFYAQDRFDQALKYWQMALDLDPQNAEIQTYTKRLEEEDRQLAQIIGMQDDAADEHCEPAPLNSQSRKTDSKTTDESANLAASSASADPVARVSATIKNPNSDEPTDAGTTRAETAILGDGRRTLVVESGLSVGLSEAVGNQAPGTGWNFTGYIDIHPRSSPLFVRVGLTYSDAGMKTQYSTTDETDALLNITGAGLDGLVHVLQSSASSVYVGGGMGAYRVTRSVYDAMVTDHILERSTHLGFSLTTGWDRKIGSLGFITNIRFLSISSSPSGQLWHFAVGIKK